MAVSLDNLRAVDLSSLDASQVEFFVSKDIQGPFINGRLTDKLTICAIEVIEANMSQELGGSIFRPQEDHHAGLFPGQGTGSYPSHNTMEDIELVLPSMPETAVVDSTIRITEYAMNNFKRLDASYFMVTAPEGKGTIAQWISGLLNRDRKEAIFVQAKACSNI